MECGISKQAHAQVMSRLAQRELMIPLYLGMILEVRQMHPGMGLRTIYNKIKPDGIGRDAFIALGVRGGLAVEYQRNSTITTRIHPHAKYRNLLTKQIFTNINQVWSSDITYYKLKDRFYYIVLIMDVYSRRVLGYALSDNLRAERNIIALRMALELRGVDDYLEQLIHHSDRGSQYVSKDYTTILQEHSIRISMCRCVYENAHLERINSTIKNQYLKKWKIKSKYDLQNRLDDAIYAYNYDRPHQSLNDLSPVDFEVAIKQNPGKYNGPMKIFTIDNRIISFDPMQMTIF